MNLKSMIVTAGLAASLAACSGGAQEEGVLIDKPDFKTETGIFDIDALEALGRVSDVKVSPDGTKVLFAISYESVEENKSNADLYTMNLDGSDLKRITRTGSSEGNFCWLDGGKKIAFTYPVDGKPQVWTMNADGSDRKQASDVEKGVEGLLESHRRVDRQVIARRQRYISRPAQGHRTCHRRPHVQALGRVDNRDSPPLRR